MLIHGFECGSKLVDVDGFTLGGYVGADASVFTLGGCTAGSTLVSGAVGMVIFCGKIFLFWIFGNIAGNGKICKQGWTVLLCKM